MSPLGTPEARCSARGRASAGASGEPSNPRASATATSSAALDDRPAPTGRVVDTVPTAPTAGRTTATTPATYRAQLGSTVDGSATSRGTRAGRPFSDDTSSTSVP